ncbi:hypothetical protein D7X87_07770 [bacterium D16-54]|nr:hypothetical protein D7X87_07770 [bacterium D16-54]RKJ15320.1 hypothetical protein D7X65_07875 [bacterium D16-56]
MERTKRRDMENLKIKLKKYIPSKLIKIRKNCLTYTYAINGRWRKSKISRKAINEKISIIFLVYMPQTWNSLKTVYDRAKEYIECETYLVVIPYNTMLGDGTLINSVKYWESLYPGEVISAKGQFGWLDLKQFNPDIIFRQEPYDNTFPQSYSCKRLSSIARLCYISYGMTMDRRHLKTVYSHRFMSDVYAFFCDTHEVKEYLEETKNKHPLIGSYQIYYYGFPRFERINTSYKFNRSNHTFTWIPRWTLDGKNNDASSFFLYCAKLIRYFEANQKLNLIIRPHPMMFSNFIDNKILTKEEVRQLFEKINSVDNICLDSEMDYLITFEKTDVLIADFSSLNMEFALSGKPIIYCGKNIKGCLTEFSDYCYSVRDWEGLKKQIEELSRGCDKYLEERIICSKKHMERIPNNISDNIVKACIEMCRMG